LSGSAEQSATRSCWRARGDSNSQPDEGALLARYLTLVPEDAGQRGYELREVFNGLRWIVGAGRRGA